MEIRKGDIVWVNLSGSEGSEQGNNVYGKPRLCCIIQNDCGNHFSPCTIIAPFTSKRKHSLPTHVDIEADENIGITRDSTLLLEQIRTIDKKRIISFVGHISNPAIMNRVMIACMANFSS